MKFKLNGCFEPVLSGDRDPFAVGKEGVCGPEIVGRGEGKVCGLTDGREDVKVGEGSKDENKDDGLYGSRSSASSEGSWNGTHCFGDLALDNKDEHTLGGCRELNSLPKRETGPLNSRWSNVGQGNTGNGNGGGGDDDGEVSLAVVRIGRLGGIGKVVRPDIYCPIAATYVIGLKRKLIDNKISYHQTLFLFRILHDLIVCVSLSNSLFRDHWLI